jgi:hypothetical protein
MQSYTKKANAMCTRHLFTLIKGKCLKISKMAFFTYLLITRLLIIRKINSMNSGLLHRRPQTQQGCDFSSSQPLSFWSCNNSPPPHIAPSAGVIATPFFSLSIPLPALRDAVRKGDRRRPSVSSHMTLLANHPEPPSQSSQC